MDTTNTPPISPLPKTPPPASGAGPRPTHISLSSQSPIFGLPPSSSPSQRENPFERPLLSPTLTFYTAPSTPRTSPSLDDPPPNPPASPPPPEVVLHVPPPPSPHASTRVSLPVHDHEISPAHDEAFPNVDQVPVDPFLEDEGLSSLEKIYLFSRSQATFHRVFIMHELPSFLEQISPSEAVEYVLPLLSGLAMDPDEQVKEALAAELVPIMWWFFSHCQIVEDDTFQDWSSQLQPNNVTYIPVQAFTPILGTLLLSPNGMVGGPARYAVVEVLSRMRKADERERNQGEGHIHTEEDDEDDYPSRLFGKSERKMFQDEILQQVVIGMGKLDASEEEQDALRRGWDDGDEEAGLQPHQALDTKTDIKDKSTPPPEDVVNPYFPTLPTDWAASSAASNPQAVASPLTPATNTFATSPTAATAGGKPEANANPGLHVSFAQLPEAPSLVASYQPEDQVVFSPDWLPPNPRPTPPDPPIAKQEWPSKTDDGRGADETDHGTEVDEQAAVGRLSSMSLIAAVTASGLLGEETKTAFVKEVGRIGRDQIYWVRREASFALGALAKIVPEEVVVCSLLPVFESLCQDSVWHVRHSALFALPAILSRLTPKQRRSLAIDTVIPLSVDESESVRLGVLEALGEVLYTFHEDEDGPPEEILRLFLGRPEDRRVHDEQQPSPPSLGEQFAKQQVWGAPKSPFASQIQDIDTMASPAQEESHLESFYRDPARPLICAFNYPAVALTLGRARWGELRELYVALSQDPAVKIRRTLAASLGELAKIIGPDNAQQDLLPVWWESIMCKEDGEVRLKAIECVGTFVDALGEKRVEVAEGLLDVWKVGTLRGWRERQVAVGAFVGFIRSISEKKPSVIKGLLKVALEDRVAGVREAAISIIPQVWKAFCYRQDVLDELQADIRNLAESPTFRNRMTFIACQQALVAPGPDGKPSIVIDDRFWKDLDTLVNDEIIGVRISLARFICLLRAQFSQELHFAGPVGLRNIMRCLAVDSSQEVRSFVPDEQSAQLLSPSAHASKRVSKRISDVSTFSRPPPLEVTP